MMAVTANLLKTKLKIQYEEGSKTFSNCREDVEDQNIYQAAALISSLQSTPAEKIIKITESELADI
ncbi:DUF1659 domain-containing protein [Defluviitalea saccharophila]|uniref:DUF1659 domain-containing protein n=1 Tax=Defluviitalea saccharophila TaxID=879970 RepID=A0ABZ2Y3J2_9FIRM